MATLSIMSEYGDKVFRRLLRIIKGEESGTQERFCPRCGKDLSRYVQSVNPDANALCEDCIYAVGEEKRLARRQAAKPPVYDIDLLLNQPGRRAYETVDEFNRLIDPDCPEALLLQPELVVRDFCEFNAFTGHDLGYILGLSAGQRIFLLGLRAFEAIGATKMVQWMSEFRAIAISLGIDLPHPVPEDWFGTEFPYDVEVLLDEESRRLSEVIKPFERYGELTEILVDYLHEHVELLRQRRASATDA
jgi:hypothetical protein